VAGHKGLAEDWLNDAVKGFLPGSDPDAQRFYASDSLIVDVASPRYLLAMKLFAARAEIGAEDIALLYRQLGFTTVDEGLDLVEQAYPGRAIPPKVRFPPPGARCWRRAGALPPSGVPRRLLQADRGEPPDLAHRGARVPGRPVQQPLGPVRAPPQGAHQLSPLTDRPPTPILAAAAAFDSFVLTNT
jgi:hypothetical protein